MRPVNILRVLFVCLRYHFKFFYIGFCSVLLALPLDHVSQLYARLFSYPEGIPNFRVVFPPERLGRSVFYLLSKSWLL